MLAPHARLRPAVVASAGPGEALAAQLREASSRMGLEEEAVRPFPEAPRAERTAWALLLARTYEVLPLVCPRCGQTMRLVAFVTEGASARRILQHVGETAEPPALAPSRAPPVEEFEWDQEAAEDVDPRTAQSEADC